MIEKKENVAKRIDWLDVLKCIAMYIVLVGHVSKDNTPDTLRYYIYSFHMPLFFMISGMGLYLQMSNRKYNIKTMLKNKAQTLLLPYLLFNIIMIPLWLFNFKFLTYKNESIVELILAIFYSNQKWNSLPTSTTWFITTLFLAVMLYFIVVVYCEENEKFIVLYSVVIGLIGYAVSLDTRVDFHYPWHLDTVPMGCMLIMMGYMFIKHLDFFDNIIGEKWYRKVVWLVVFIVIGYCCARFNVKISMGVNSYGSFILFIGAVIAFSMACYILSRFIPNAKVFKLIGRNTLVYLAVHEQIYRIFQFYSKTSKAFIVNYPILTATIVFVGLIPVVWLVEKYFPFLLGKKKRKFV